MRFYNLMIYKVFSVLVFRIFLYQKNAGEPFDPLCQTSDNHLDRSKAVANHNHFLNTGDVTCANGLRGSVCWVCPLCARDYLR